MKRIVAIIICLLSLLHYAHSQQDAQLADHYYQSGEYEKSAQIYKKLSDFNGYNEYYFNQYLESLMAIDAYDEAENSIKNTLRRYPQNIELHVSYGNLLERIAKPELAEDQYQMAINKLNIQNINSISSLGNSFMRLTKYALALKIFLKGEELSDNQGIYAYSIAEIYRRKNETENMISYFLKSQMARLDRISSVQNYFTQYFSSKDDYDILRKKLYEKVQESPDDVFYPEMIQWVFIQNKEYNKALRQARALDLRLEENGTRIYQLARTAANDMDYDTAIDAYEYILTSKPSSSSYFLESKKELLDVKRKKITRSTYTIDDLLGLEQEYIQFLDENGRGSRTSLIILEMAELEAIYLNRLDTAIDILNELITYPGINNYVKANAKLALSDYYLMTGDVWESTLLYSQVDKDFREDHLGELARFKNAKLSYYIGDFEWAQEQFDILKSATTKLISNDAIDLSVFIMDNANLDTTYLPLKYFSNAELLLFQNKSAEAFNSLDSINLLFPGHSLTDDVYYIKAQYLEKTGQIDQAIVHYQSIINEFPDEIRADNAIYALAQIYEQKTGDIEKAKELYEKLLMEYSDSTFAIDARKRFRILRGDNIQ